MSVCMNVCLSVYPVIILKIPQISLPLSLFSAKSFDRECNLSSGTRTCTSCSWTWPAVDHRQSSRRTSSTVRFSLAAVYSRTAPGAWGWWGAAERRTRKSWACKLWSWTRELMWFVGLQSHCWKWFERWRLLRWQWLMSRLSSCWFWAPHRRFRRSLSEVSRAMTSSCGGWTWWCFARGTAAFGSRESAKERESSNKFWWLQSFPRLNRHQENVRNQIKEAENQEWKHKIITLNIEKRLFACFFVYTERKKLFSHFLVSR